jgi:hypothetical protein
MGETCASRSWRNGADFGDMVHDLVKNTGIPNPCHCLIDVIELHPMLKVV